MKNKDKKGKQNAKPAAYDVKNNKFNNNTENCSNCCTNSNNNQCSDSKR